MYAARADLNLYWPDLNILKSKFINKQNNTT